MDQEENKDFYKKLALSIQEGAKEYRRKQRNEAAANFTFHIFFWPIAIGSWIYAMSQWGFLLGFGLGWIPSAIAAWIIAKIAETLWPLLALLVAIGVIWFLISLI